MKRLANTLIFTLLFTSLSVYNAFAFSGEGSGTEEDPYQITTVEQLQEMNDDLTAHYILVNDIDASATSTWNGGKGFTPVGTFTGALNGNGFSVYSLYINRPATDYIGLFSILHTGGQGSVQNLKLKFCEVTGYRQNGILAGCIEQATVRSVHVSGQVNGAFWVGGLAGRLIGGAEIYSCSVNANIACSDHYAGGITGMKSLYSIIENSYAVGSVTGTYCTGGLIGTTNNCNGYVKNCYAAATINDGAYSGGLLGKNDGSADIRNSFWDKETSGQSASAGGTGKTTAEMKDVATFTSTATIGLDNPWDFVGDPNDDTGSQDYWNIKQGINSGYPYLKFEEPSGNIFYVDKNAAGLGNGLSWTNAYNHLQDALNDKWLEEGDTVWVADATYLPDEGTGYTAGARDTCFSIPDGVELYGGFSGTETSHEQRDPDANITILSGDIGSAGDAADNSIHVLTAGNNVIIDGFTIKHGNANGSNEQSLGGGIYLKENSTGIKIENCTLRENNAGQGGAVSADGFVDFSISSCIFYANTATHGAAVHCENSEGNIYYSTFAENTALNYGAGLYYWGAGSGSPEIRNCTFYQNEAPSGASIHCRAAGINAQVLNSLHYGSTGDDIVLTNGAAIAVSYSRIPQAGYTGNNNNIDDDPMIESFSEGSLQLYSISPCIDAGDPSSPNDPDNTRANMGNFHSTTDDVTNPVLTTKDATLYLGSEGTGTIQKQDVVENASDNLAVADTSLSRQSFSCADTEAAVLIDVTLTDLYSNSDTEQSSITVLDTISPVITCPGNQYVEAGPGDIYTVSGSEFDPAETGDNCSVAGYQNDYNNLSTLDGAEIPYGTTTIVWTVTDNSGNTKSCSFDVDVSEYTNIYQDEEDKIKVYPNPVRDKLKIINLSGESLNYSIADLTGNMLIKAELTGNEIDVSSLDEGMYILKINDHFFKIIKK